MDIFRYSIIIPALNEFQWIQSTIQSITAQARNTEIIVADGGSSDGTPETAHKNGAQVLSCRAGRGNQCNAGANAAEGDILLFLHADTRMPPNAFQILDGYFQNPQVKIGTFRLRFHPDHVLLRLYGYFSRFDSILSSFGDQCIVVRRSFFLEIGGFPDWPLFEDVHFLRAARQQTKIHSFPAEVKTSARRFLEEGVFLRQLKNGWLILQYISGVSPFRLAQQYRSSLSGPMAQPISDLNFSDLQERK